ncbi:MAG: membrane protein insertase YidC [Gemmataceae bacterium]|nr:membrane protein insertase YidC [Gemmataceae bacterium]
MRQNSFNAVFFVLLAGVATVLFWYADRNWLPKADRPKDAGETAAADAPPKPTAEAVAAVAGAAVGVPAPPPPKAEPKPPPPPKKADPPTLFALGDDEFYLKALLSTRGGGVQQVVLTRFNEADRIGREAKQDGKPVPLYLIPGVKTVRPFKLDVEFVPPDLAPGPVTDPDVLARLAEPSYTLAHYATAEADDHYPDPYLATANWKKVGEDRPQDGGRPHSITFEAELGDPYFVKIRKTFTLGPKDYHLGLAVTFERLPGGQKGKGQLRYQLSGPRGLPVEGEWYTSTTRTCLIGWQNPKGADRRQYEDAASITNWRGGAEVPRADKTFKYAAVATQYFTSALCIAADPPDAGKGWWAYVRGTSELPFPPPADETKRLEEAAKDAADPVAAAAAAAQLARIRDEQHPKLPELADITFRAVSEPLDLAPGEKAAHGYAVYNGPTKVRLLNLLGEDRGAVDSELVTTYLDTYDLRTLTDYQSPTWLGAFANAIYWTDLVVAFTNIMHGLLWAIHQVIPVWGLSIIVLTVMVRLLLFVPSRKQTAMNLKMVEVQKRLKPELDKLHEKYKDDLPTYNREKTRLMMQHGLNPFVMMGGCLLLLAQSPMIMGLYFCLQESIFFRLQPFLWFDNLAAPDMTVWWGEGIPVLSDPAGRYGGFSFLYLGPFLNVLPLVAVGLMLYQQMKMMPPPTDEQAAQQRMTMKIMLGVMALMFYKVAAGLALYFIVGTVWGIIERQLIPKPKLKDGDLAAMGPSANGAAPPRPKGRFGRFMERLRERIEEAQRQAEEQSSRQFKNPNRQPPPRRPDRPDENGTPDRKGPDRDRDRKKKRRK